MFKFNVSYFKFGISFLTIFIFLKFFPIDATKIDAWDNLDGAFVAWKLLSEIGFNYFNPNYKIENIFDGVFVGSIYPHVSFGELIYIFISAEYAYLINEFIARIIAFVGFLLLSTYLINEGSKEKFKSILFAVSICYSLLPFNPTPFLTIAGQPLLLYALLKFYNKEQRLTHWIICIIFPFYSSIILGGEVILMFLAAINFFYIIKLKKINWNLILVSLIIFFLYILSIYKGLYVIFIEDSFVSIRSIFNPSNEINIQNVLNAIKEAGGILIFGDGHAPSLHTYFILSSILISLLIITKKNKYYIFLISLIIVNVLTSVIFGILDDSGFGELIKTQFEFSQKFTLNRINHSQTIIWYFAFLYALLIILESKNNFLEKNISLQQLKSIIILLIALFVYIQVKVIPFLELKYINEFPDDVVAIKTLLLTFIIMLVLIISLILISYKYKYAFLNFIKKQIKIKVLIVFFFLIGQGFYNINLFKLNKLLTFNHKFSWHHAGVENTTFEKYFLKNNFKKINNIISEKDKKNYKVGSIGLSPSIALYHGFNVADMYLPNYNLSYKNKFYFYIKDEIIKSQKIYEYFVNTGKRCYFFSTEIGTHPLYFKHDVPKLINPSFNYNLLKQNKIKFLFSISAINNNDNLIFLGKFINDDYEYLNDIYLYELK